jgi:HPt (histidine-containing phosphotransfer) domain-containing protein
MADGTYMADNGIIDWTQLLALRDVQMPGDPDIVPEVIAMFLEDSRVRLARARAAQGNRDAKALRLEAHTLRGTAGLIGAENLRVAAEALERDAANGDWKRMGMALDVVAGAVEAACTELEAFAPPATSPSPVPHSLAE